MAEGFSRTLERGGEPDRAIVLRGGTAQGELSSNIDTRRMFYVSGLDGIEYSSAEVYMVADIPKRVDYL